MIKQLIPNVRKSEGNRGSFRTASNLAFYDTLYQYCQGELSVNRITQILLLVYLCRNIASIHQPIPG